MWLPYVALYVAIALTISGSLFTISTYFIFPESRTTSQVFAVWLAIGALGVIGSSFYGHLCITSAVTVSYFSLITICTAIVVSTSIRRIFDGYRRDLFDQRHIQFQIETWHYAFVWGTPLVLAALPLTTDSYGRNDGDIYCWIKTDFEEGNEVRNHIGYMWEVVTFYAPLVLGVGYISVVYSRVIGHINGWKNDSVGTSRKKAQRVVSRLYWYPIILVAVYILPFTRRILQVFNHHYRTLVLLAEVSLRLQGFLDAVAYGVNPNVIKHWKGLLNKCFCSSDPLLRESSSSGARSGSFFGIAMTVFSGGAFSTWSRNENENNSGQDSHKNSSDTRMETSDNPIGWRYSVSDFDEDFE